MIHEWFMVTQKKRLSVCVCLCVCLCACLSLSQVGDAMRRMHERHNIGKVILLPEPKKEEKAESIPEPAATDNQKEEAERDMKEAPTEEDQAEKN